MTYAVIESTLLTLVLLTALWSFYGRLAPQSQALLRRRLGERLARNGEHRLLQRIGRHILPKNAPAACGDGCSRCGGCPVGDTARRV